MRYGGIRKKWKVEKKNLGSNDPRDGEFNSVKFLHVLMSSIKKLSIFLNKLLNIRLSYLEAKILLRAVESGSGILQHSGEFAYMNIHK
jgi:hypothetical protein